MKTLHLWFEWLKLGMQRHSKAFGWNMTGSLHWIIWSNIKKLASLRNTMIQKWFMVSKFLTMPYSSLFEFQVLGFICNTYYIVLFVVGFDAPLGRCLWLMLWTQHWLIVKYLQDNTPMVQRLHKCSTTRPMGSHPPLVMNILVYPTFD